MPALRRLVDSRLLLGGLYGLAFLLTGAAVTLGSSPSLAGVLGPASPLVLTLLALAFASTAVVAGAMAWRVVRMLRARSADAGARLHLRFITLFALAAVAPAMVVALFFGVLVTRGVDSWFNARVATVVENSATVARSYVDEQKDFIGQHVAALAAELNRAAPALADSPIAFSRFLADQAADNGFSAAFLIDRQGRVLARSAAQDGPAMLIPPASTFAAADQGDISVGAFESFDLFRALYRLSAYPDAYLYVTRPVDRGIFRHLRETEASLVAYREAKSRRGLIQAGFVLSYLETALLVLVGAVWLGIGAASRIAAPVARLAQAAGRVAAGDLTARVADRGDPEELAGLTRAFNAMTEDLARQQAALRAAGEEAQSRRLFMEAVLAGVSAGVVGLDTANRIRVVNAQAARLLGLGAKESTGLFLGEAAPELEAVINEARELGEEIERDLDITRAGQTRRLRVRAGHSREGLVLTFDDISRLVAAQRNAAWRDVARRIAHEIKNPLTPIQLSAERLRRKYRKELAGDLETFDRCTETIVRQVGDIGRMVDEFSAFARMPAPQFAGHEAAELLRQAVFAQRVADPETSIEIVEPARKASLDCDGRIVVQALANVLKNAGEAIGARRAREPGHRGRIVATLALDGGRIEFRIEDNGVGLPAQDRGRLTEPYVTTREKGTGLGLAIVARILEEHGGVLSLADADHGPGARVTLSFPASRGRRRPRLAVSQGADA